MSFIPSGTASSRHTVTEPLSDTVGSTRICRVILLQTLSAREAAQASVPSLVHSKAEVRRWIAQWVVQSTDLWVAESGDGALVGLLVLADGSIDQLYVAPWLTGCGIGSELLALAKRERPDGLRLWTFESNVGAQRFYERHGFTAAKRTSGDNEEGAPDILYAWCGADR